RGAHEICARRQRSKPVRAIVVSSDLIRARWNELTPSVEVHRAKRVDIHTLDRFVVFIGDTPCDDSHPRHRKIDVVERLSVGDLDGLTGFERAPLPVLNAKIATTFRPQRVSAGWQIGQFIPSIEVCARGARLSSQLRSCGGNTSTTERLSGIANKHSAANDGSADA